MLEFRTTNAKAALAYYGEERWGVTTSTVQTSAGRWADKLVKILGLSADPDPEQFARLLQGLDPHTGGQLTAKLVDGRLAGWDLDRQRLPRWLLPSHWSGVEFLASTTHFRGALLDEIDRLTIEG